jgi:hypothetical protein
MDTTEDMAVLEEILGDLTYPAEKWQITTCAELYGANVRARRELYGLPARVYDSPSDVRSALG